MATKINVTKPKYNEKIATPEMSAVNGTSTIAYSGGRTGVLLVMYSSTGGSVTIKGGDGVFGLGDMTIAVGAGENMHLLLEPGAFLQTEGEYKGCLVVTGSGCMIGAVELD